MANFSEQLHLPMKSRTIGSVADTSRASLKAIYKARGGFHFLFQGSMKDMIACLELVQVELAAHQATGESPFW